MKRKGETNQQWMDRLRAARGLPPQTRENLMEKVAAARCYVGTITNPERAKEVELVAFMDIFHPEVPQERVQELRRAVRSDQ